MRFHLPPQVDILPTWGGRWKEWTRGELRAELYAYKKTGEPKNIMDFLMDLSERLVDTGAYDDEEADEVVRGALKSVWKDLPKAWKSEIREYTISPY